MSEQAAAEVSQGEFLASMELYQHDDGIHAIVRVQGNGEANEVLVPPHMAAMLPQAIAMLQQEDTVDG